MSAQAIPAVLSPEPKTETKRKALPRVRIRLGSHTVVRLPGPEALLHPRAAEALILAFRPLSWGR